MNCFGYELLHACDTYFNFWPCRAYCLYPYALNHLAALETAQLGESGLF